MRNLQVLGWIIIFLSVLGGVVQFSLINQDIAQYTQGVFSVVEEYNTTQAEKTYFAVTTLAILDRQAQWTKLQIIMQSFLGVSIGLLFIVLKNITSSNN